MPQSKQKLYRVSFQNQGSGGGQIYEVYAREVSHAAMLGFIEIGKLVFGEKSTVVVDTSEEKLKTEFSNVDRFYVPVHAIIRIDEVSKPGSARIHPTEGGAGAKPTSVYNFSDYKK